MMGERLHSSWLLASENLSAALSRFGPQLEALRHSLVATARGAGGAFLQMFFSIIISGIFLATAQGSVAGTQAMLNGLVGERGPLLLTMSKTTVRSVARGVLGVAIIESILAAIGMVLAGMPAFGFWTFLILVFSIVQVPPLLLLIPLVIYAFSVTEPAGATVFLIFSALAVAVDTFLKPILLGRAADAPMLVVLLGAIGGMMLWGIIGLFVGAVVLALSWEGLVFWIMEDDDPATERPGSVQEQVESNDK